MKKDTSEDFSFDWRGNNRDITVNEGCRGITRNGKTQQLEDKDLAGKAMAQIYCKDYGAHAVIEAKVFTKDDKINPIATLTLRVPYDADGDKIATAWKAQFGQNFPATLDADVERPTSGAIGRRGDGWKCPLDC